MKCPKFHAALINDWQRCRDGDDDCLKEECAWWVKASESCAMEAIPRIIGYVGGELKAIKEKTPPHIPKH